MKSRRPGNIEADSQLARVQALAEGVALPLDAQRLASLARLFPGPSPLDRYDFGDLEPLPGLRLDLLVAPRDTPDAG